MADRSAPRTRAIGICPCHAVTARCAETQAQRQGETCVQRRTSAGFIAAAADVYRHRYSYSTHSHPAAKSELAQYVQISASLTNSDAIRLSSRRRSWSVPLGKRAKPSLHVWYRSRRNIDETWVKSRFETPRPRPLVQESPRSGLGARLRGDRRRSVASNPARRGARATELPPAGWCAGPAELGWW